MHSFFLFLNIMSGCPATTVVDWTHDSWELLDSQTYQRATQQCVVKFGSDAPCLKKFIKKEKGTYYAICGRANSKVPSSIDNNVNWFLIREGEISVHESSQSRSKGPSCNGREGTCPYKPNTGRGGK